MRQWAFGAALAAALCVACGCGNSRPLVSLKDPGPPKLDPGWKTYDLVEEGCSIAAPPTWGKFIPSATSMGTSGLEGEGAGAAQMEAMLKQMDAEEAAAAEEKAKKDKERGIVLTLFDQSQRRIVAEIPTSFIIMKMPTSRSLDEDVKDYMKEWRDQDKKGDARIELPVGPAHEVITELVDVKGDAIHRIAYILVHKDSQYRIIFRATNNPSAIQTIARDVAETFRVKV